MGSINSDSLPKAPGRVRRQVAPVTAPTPDPEEASEPIEDPEEMEAVESEDGDEPLLDDEEDDEDIPPPPPPTRVVHQAGKPAMGRRSRPVTAETTTPVVPSESKAVKTSFKVMLKEAATYDYNGMHFRRGIPADVPIRYYETFKSNGFFVVLG